MNQTEATQRVADALYEYGDFETVGILEAVIQSQIRYVQPTNRVLAKDHDGTTWSVTVEILAQP